MAPRIGAAWGGRATRAPSARRRALRHGLTLAGLLAGVFVWQAIAIGVPNSGDAWSYWSASAADPYAAARQGAVLSYLYSPAFLQALAPLRLLDWDAFRAVWTATLVAALVLQAGPLTVLALAFPPVLIDLEVGNIHVLLALAIVLGFRWPAAWAFVLLTKVTPGVGLLWFALRREWRQLGIAIVATVSIAVVSFLLAPHLWTEWLVVAGPADRGLRERADPPAGSRARGRRSRVRGCPHGPALSRAHRLNDRPPRLWWNGFAMLVGLARLLPNQGISLGSIRRRVPLNQQPIAQADPACLGGEGRVERA